MASTTSKKTLEVSKGVTFIKHLDKNAHDT